MQHSGSDVITVIVQSERIPPFSLTFTLSAGGKMLADAHAIIQSLPQNTATIQPTAPAPHPTRRLRNKASA